MRNKAEKKESPLRKVDTHDLPEELTEVIAPLISRSQELRQLAEQMEGKTMAYLKGWMIAKGIKGENIQLSRDGKTVTI